MNSGERITVGVAAISASGEVLVLPTLREKELNCIFGEQGKALLKSAEIALAALRQHLNQTHSFAGWDSPLSGVTIGDTHLGAGNNLHSILGTAMRLTASFCANLPSSAASMAVTTFSASIPTEPEDEESWSIKVRELIHRNAPPLFNNFNREKEFVQGGRPPKFDYFGRQYVANFGRLTISRLNDGFNKAKIKLWDLDVLRADSALAGINHYELVLWRPRLNGDGYSKKNEKLLKETIVELTEEARKRELETVPVYDAEEASSRIIQMEGLERI